MSSNSQSSEEEEDISPLEYARNNGLSRDYLAEPFPASLVIVPEDIDGQIANDSRLPQFDIPNCNTDERLSISKDAAILLAWISKVEEPETINSLVLSMLRSGKPRIKHFDLPLLRTDHEIDCKEFAKREGFEIMLKDLKLPLEMVDDEKDEGLGFPASLWDKGSKIMNELKKERFSVRKETLFYIQDALKTEWDEEVEKEVWASAQNYKENRALEPVTPPLSPIPSLPEPFEPSLSDPAFQLPILSDPVSLTREDLDKVEKLICSHDVPIQVRAAMDEREETSSDTHPRNDNFKLGDIYSPLASLDGANITPTTGSPRRTREKLKVEETLTPPDFTSLPKTVHFNRIVEEMVFNAPSSPHEEPLQSSFFEDAFGDAGQRAMRMAEQETLSAADTTARVEVPKLDFSTVDPPWKMFQSQRTAAALMALQKALIRESIGQLPSWPVLKSVDNKLKWNPFPHSLAMVAVDEDLGHDDEVWKNIVNGPGEDGIIDTASLTWKPPGLKILKDEEDDDEIEPARFRDDHPKDLSYLAKKRKMEMKEERQALENSTNLKSNNQIYSGIPNTEPSKPTGPIGGILHSAESGLLGERCSITAALDNFQTLRGTKKQKLLGSSYFPVQPANTTAEVPTDKGIDMQIPIRPSPDSKVDPLPAPEITSPAVPPSIIVSSLILRNRALIKQIETQLPGLKLVERDFTAHNTTAWIPNSVTRSPIASPLGMEADIIVSPMTGIILTTFQKIKQKPLPGQKTKAAIRDRVERVGLKYERILVLVSEGRSDGSTNGLDESDCVAFSEFVGFTSGLSTSVVVQFLGGREETLSKWLLGNIIQYSKPGVCDLLEDETHWELFLRRAGMNAFAAQAIIANLKAPDGVDATSPTKIGHFGLVAFVEMSQEQRVARFGNLCGTRLLERVGAVVDARWE